MFLLGLFDGPIFHDQAGLLWFWPFYSFTAPFIFYCGIGLVILGTVLLGTTGRITTEKVMEKPSPSESQTRIGGRRLSHFSIDIGLALIAGVVGAAVNNFVAWAASFGSNGFPFAVTVVTPGCFGPGGSIGCVAYYPLGIALDGAFWACLVLVIGMFADFTTTVHARTRLAAVTVRKISQ